MSEQQREILRAMTQEAEALGLYDRPEIAAQDSTDEEIIDVLLPVQELRAENDSLRRQLGKWQSDFESSAIECEKLCADLNCATLHNRALSKVVEEQSAELDKCIKALAVADVLVARADALSKVVDAARKVVSPNTQSRMSALWALSAALESIDKAQP